MMEIEGYYFGNKTQFDARHNTIKEVLESEFAKVIAKEQANERRKAAKD
jgi:septin family protein